MPAPEEAVFEFGPLWLVALHAPAAAYGPYWALLVATLGAGGYLATRLHLGRRATLGIRVMAPNVMATWRRRASGSAARCRRGSRKRPNAMIEASTSGFTVAFAQYEAKYRDYASVSHKVNAGRLLAPASHLGIRARNVLFSALSLFGPLMKLVDSPAKNIKLEDYADSAVV